MTMTVSQIAFLPQVMGRTTSLALLFAAELAILGVAIPGYLTVDGLLDASRSFAEAGIVAMGMTLVIITGGIDLSVGSLLSLVSVSVGFGYQAGLPLPASLCLGLFVGIAGGALNGALIVALGLQPLLVTLGSFALFRGIAYAISSANAVSSFPEWFGFFGQDYLADVVPVQLIAFLLAAVVTWIILNKARIGRYVIGVGNNELALQFAGIRTDLVKIFVYALDGFFIAIAAIIFTSKISSARGNAGLGLELTVIAMVVLGGVKITGGSGDVLGVVFGVLIISYLQDGLSFAGVPGDFGLVVTGLVLVAAVFLNEAFRKDAR